MVNKKRGNITIPPPDRVALGLTKVILSVMADSITMSDQVDVVMKYITSHRTSTGTRVEYGMQLMDAQILLETVEPLVGGDLSELLLRNISSMRDAENEIRAIEPEFAKIDRREYYETTGDALTDQVVRWLIRAKDYAGREMGYDKK